MQVDGKTVFLGLTHGQLTRGKREIDAIKR